ncbi:MAG: hypothetical protein D6710_10290 [Nitrospirae bacterium]|nr:MAG: hypothetical protein D6710_10290 [Nitrospirota bacterium]
MKRLIIFVVLVSLFSVISCTKAMRYTNEEISGYPAQVQEHIKKGEVVTGMTMQQVRYAWGAPNEIRPLPSTPDGKERVQWTYKRLLGAFKTHLRFTDGVLTEIISTEPGIAK